LIVFVGEDAVVFAEVEEVAKVVGRAGEDCAGRFQSPQGLGRVPLEWVDVEGEAEMEIED
jgi:hypothetical protein